MIIKKEIYQYNDNGENILIDTIDIEIEGPTQEEIIAEKEAELLRVYAEIQELKNNI